MAWDCRGSDVLSVSRPAVSKQWWKHWSLAPMSGLASSSLHSWRKQHCELLLHQVPVLCCLILILVVTDTTTTVLEPLFPGPPGWASARRELRTLGCKGRLTEADTLTIRLGATPSGLSSAHLHHPPISYRPDALPAAQPTVSKHWMQLVVSDTKTSSDVRLPKCVVYV